MTARREFGGAIAGCAIGAALVLLAVRQGWARVAYHAPAPLPSGSVAVTGQAVLPAAGALALAALACLAAIIATRGLARRVAGVAMAGLGVWIAGVVGEPLHAAGVIAAAAGSSSPAGLAGTLPAGNSAISGNPPSGGGGLPVIGTATRVVLSGAPWRLVAVAGAVVVIAAGLLSAWRGPRWPVMSARFDRPDQRQPAQGGQPAGAQRPDGAPQPTGAEEPLPTPGPPPEPRPPPDPGPSPDPGPPPGAGRLHPDGDVAALWEALDRGVDLTDTPGQDAVEPVAVRGDEQ